MRIAGIGGGGGTCLGGRIAGSDDGFELNVLGLVTGFDFKVPALKLPGVGRVPGATNGAVAAP